MTEPGFYLVWVPRRVPGAVHRPFTEWAGVRPCAEFLLNDRVSRGGRGRLVEWSPDLEQKVRCGEHFGSRWRQPFETC